MIVHHNISDLYKTLNLPFDSEIDFTILSIPEIHAEIPFKSPVLQANYYSFILTKDGSGIYNLDNHKFPFSSKSFYFTTPGHIKSYELVESKEALIIVLSDKFLQDYVNVNTFNKFPFLLAEKSPPHQLSESDFEEFETLYQQMLREFGKNSSLKKVIFRLSLYT